MVSFDRDEEMMQCNGIDDNNETRGSPVENAVPEVVQINQTLLEQLLNECVQLSERFTIQLFVDLYHTLHLVARKYERQFDRMALTDVSIFLNIRCTQFENIFKWPSNEFVRILHRLARYYSK